MKQRKTIQDRRIISLLIAMMLMVTTILPSVTVYSAEEAEGQETVVDVPEEAAEEAGEEAGEEAAAEDEEEAAAEDEEEAGAAEDEGSDTAQPAEEPQVQEPADAPDMGGDTVPEYDEAEEAYEEPEMPMNAEEAEGYGDAAPENGEGSEDAEKPEDTSISETIFKLGDNELVVTLEGDYSDPELSLYVPEDIGDEKEALEKAIGASALNLHVVGLRNADNDVFRFGRDGAPYEEEIPVTVSGSWITEDTELVFALMNEDGTAQIVETQQGRLDDGTVCRSFRADMLLVLMICEKGEPLPEEEPVPEEEAPEEEAVPEAEMPEEEAVSEAEPSEEELPEEAESDFTAEAEMNAPMLKAAADDTMDVTVNIGWAGSEPTDKSSRPYVVYVTMERSTDGTNWEEYKQDIPFAITSFSATPWVATFTLPAKDAGGKPYTYRITETNEGLGRYLLPKAPAVVSAASPKTTLTNTYNDEWDYHLRMYWDVSDDAGKVLQDVHTIDRSTQELTYHVAVSTQKAYEACDNPLNPTKGITVRIPRALCKDRNDNPVYPSDYSIGTETSYDPYYFFKYIIDKDTDEIVIYNYVDLPGAFNIDIKVQYKLDPMQIEDCTLGKLQAHGEGHYPNQPQTDDGKQDSDPIYYRLDTGAEFTKFIKEDGYPLRVVPPAMQESDFDFANYRYMVYILRYQIDGNQPVRTLTFTDKPHTADGENGKIAAILQPDEIDTRTGSGSSEVHTYSRPAASLSTPSGQSVKFTSGSDGSVTWSGEFDLLRKDGNGNYVNYGEQCYYLIVRYDPVKDINGYIIQDMTYHNDTATGSLEVKDPQHSSDVRPDPEKGIEGNDFKDTDKKTDDAKGHWQPDKIPPVGPGPYYADKYLGDNYYPGLYTGYTRLKYGLYHVYSATTRFDVGGDWINNKSDEDEYYYADWYDDDVYMRGYYDDGSGKPEWHDYIRLEAQDYQIWYTLQGSTYFEITAYDTDPVTGQHKPVTGVFTIQVKKSSGEWVDYDTFKLDSAGYAKITPEPFGEKGLSNKGYIGIRIKTPKGMTAHLTMKMVVWYIINGNSPVARDLIDNKGATNLQIVDHATNDLYTSSTPDGTYTIYNAETPENMGKSEYDWVAATKVADYPGEKDGIPDGKLHAYRSDGNYPKSENQNVSIAKSILKEEDHRDTHSFSHQWNINAFEYFNTASIPREVLKQMDFSADTAVFYDLLPPGYHLDVTRPIEVGGANGTSTFDQYYPASLISYTVQEDFKGTGRDLVTFNVGSEREPKDNLFIRNYTYTGFTIHFWTIVSYFDVEEDEVRNLCMYQRGDKRAMIGDVAYGDERGYGVDPNKYIVNGKYVMVDLDNDGVEQPNSAMYFSTPVHPTTVETLQDGLYKYVKGNSGVWKTEDQTGLNGTYHYQILLETADKGTTSGVVLYDVLEDAANTGGATGEKDGWHGVLQNVDVSRAESKGIDPVVYYTTKNVNYNGGQSGDPVVQDWESSLEKAPDIWSRWSPTMPADPSTITAIAIDLRWRDAEKKIPYEFTKADRVGVDLTMKAPGEMPDEEKFSIYAYNRPAFHSIIQPDGSPNKREKFNISTRTKISLRNVVFNLFKYYESGDKDENGNPKKQGLGGVTFELYQCTNTEEGHEHKGMPGKAGSCWGNPIQTKISQADGMASFTGLDTGEYAVIETAVPTRPAGLQKLDYRWWTFKVDADSDKISAPVGHSKDETDYPIVEMEYDEGTACYTLKNDLLLFNISVKKTWKGTVPAGEKLTFELYRGNEKIDTREVTIPEPDPTELTDYEWTWTFNNLFTDLERKDENGNPYRYRLKELSNAGYEITEPEDGSVEIYAPERGDITASFTNSRLGWLEIAKILTVGDPETEFKFTVELIGPYLPIADGTQFHYYIYEADDTERRNPASKEGSAVVKNEELSVSLKAGEVICFYDLPVGTKYNIKESPVAGYHQVSGAGVAGVATYDLIPQAVFTNSQDVGNLQISKKVTSGDKTKGFSVTVTLKKDGKALTGEYPLTVTGASGMPDSISLKDGKVTFRIHDGETWLISNIPAEAEYTVEETGLTEGWAQTKAENLTGTIEIDKTLSAVLENSYTPAPTRVHFEGKKTLEGRELKDAEFRFTLTGSDGYSDTVFNNGEKIVFKDIPYTAAGTYTYTVKEEATDKSGVTIDSSTKEITVVVTDDNEGHLHADDVTGGSVADLTFNNTYKPAPTRVHFEGKKTLEGRELKDAEFRFTLTGSDGYSETVSNKGEKIVFTDIPYTAAGIYTYTVKEEATDKSGVTIDSSTKEITVVVTDDKEGHLLADVTGGSVADLTFNNTYTPAPARVHFEGIKTLKGRELKDAEFSFTLTGSDGTGETVFNDGKGRISFSDITYNKTGTITYTVKEEATDKSGVTIDNTQYNITVEVTDNGKGQLEAKVTGADISALNFTNTYTNKPEPVKVHFEGTKTLKGRKLKDAEFSFTLSDSDGNDIETVKNDAKGKISFREITYDEAGTYTYEVKENATDKAGVTIDSETHEITVKVTDDGSGKLTAEVTGGDAGTLKFVNTYKPAPVSLQFEGIKTLNGRALRNAEFSFTLTGSDGTKETVTNDGRGRISFSEITYDKAGTYTYKVKEEATNEASVTIDSKVYDFTVKVTDDGSGKLKAKVTGADISALNFTNTYHPGGPPKTGDDTPLMLWLLLLAGSGAAALVLLKRRKAF